MKRGRKPGSSLSADPKSRTKVKAEPISEVPEPPTDLNDQAKAYWRELAPQLVAANLLTALHLDSFRVLCEVTIENRNLSAWLDADPERLVTTSKHGHSVPSPQVRMRDNARAQLQRMWIKFGLTPHALACMQKHGGISSRSLRLTPLASFAKKKYGE